jgi:histidyl-tRNA synthetase
LTDRKSVKPRILKGFRDIEPPSMRRRNFIINKLVDVFEAYSFEPLETPTLEYLDVLTGKMGEDTDKQIFSFVDSGDRAVGLRYELTISLARYIAMNPYLKMPFKRYQIEKVFRAEKPQKGRFREFTQCDVDIVGEDSIYADTEIISVLAEGMERLGFENYRILINDRELLFEIIKTTGISESKLTEVSRIIDKLDKIGARGVIEELRNANLTTESLENFIEEFSVDYQFDEVFKKIAQYIKNDDNLDKIRDIFKRLNKLKQESNFILRPTLARGLDYYTGPVFEVVVPELDLGSLGGGGRYDNLIGSFIGRRIPACGTSFGLDRLEIAMDELDLYPEKIREGGVLVTVFGEETEDASLEFLSELRKAGIISDIYPEPKNIGKQLGYADAKGFSYTVIIGPEEIKMKKIKIKDMKTGDETLFDRVDAVKYLIEEVKKGEEDQL